MIGLDTGFFLRVFEGHAEARAVWGQIIRGEVRGVVSPLTLFELARHGYRGLIHKARTEQFVRALPDLCKLAGLDGAESLLRAARISHGNGIPTVDAIILVSFIEAGAVQIYTTDSDFEAYQVGPEIIRL